MSDDRRPISQRSHGWAKALTRALVKGNVTPNVISFTSIVFAGFGGLCFYALGLAANAGDRTMLCIGAALFCQLRLLANMMDGMVAVEGGRGAPDGPIWNELPDRIADIFILVGAGYGVALMGAGTEVAGWAAAVAAVMTAYVREVSRAAGAPADFSGPMAKPHRMFFMTVAAILTIFEGEWSSNILAPNSDAPHGHIIALTLWFIAIMATLTALNRARRALAFMNKK